MNYLDRGTEEERERKNNKFMRRSMQGASVEQKQVNIMYIGRVPIKIIKHQKIIMLILNAQLYECLLL